MSSDENFSEDRALVDAFLQSRDEGSFRTLYRRHTPLLYALAARLAGGRTAEAEEVVQETWIRAVAGLSGFRWESALATWLCGIAIRCSREAARRTTADPAGRIAEIPSHTGRDTEMDLESAVGRLAPGYREVLLLHDVHGYTHEEIARILGIDPGTSKSQLSRARRTVREQLGRSDPGRGQENSL